MPKHSNRNRRPEASVLWAENEFSTLKVPDPRRVRRLKKMAADLHAQPGASIPQASGDWAASKAFYRFLESGAVGPAEILESHRDALVGRIAGSAEPVVLVAQDTTSLNFGERPHTRGLGRNGHKTHSGCGLMVHSSLCMGAGGQEVFGLLGAQIWARQAEPDRRAAASARNRQAIEQKESHRWVEGWRQADALHGLLGGQRRVVSISDREGDLYEAFALCLQARARAGGAAELLVRSRHERRLRQPQPGQSSWRHVEALPPAASIEIMVPRSPGKAARRARLEVRYAQVELSAPMDKVKYLGLKEPLRLWLIIAQEKSPAAGCPPIVWRLWTTVPIEGPAQAIEAIGWYAKRWLIEEFHRILKSGCKVEQRQLESAEKLCVVLALDMVLACHLLGLTKAAREHPSQCASGWLQQDQWQALYCYIHQTNDPPPCAPTLQNAVLWIARLGGFLNRNNDGMPGSQVLWKGLQRLHDITATYRLFANQKICG